MPRNGDDARRRLREAALELYRENGYDLTTTAAIAERAGVTERTYFRHFADKREVLFDGEGELRDVLVGAIEGAPPEQGPLAVLALAYAAAVPLFVKGRRVAVLREQVIVVTPALQERAHAKSAALMDSLSAALVDRGLPLSSALLAAQVGRAAFARAMRDWDGTSAAQLNELIARAFDEVRSLG